MIRTVLGEIAPNELGVTYMHEHLINQQKIDFYSKNTITMLKRDKLKNIDISVKEITKYVLNKKKINYTIDKQIININGNIINKKLFKIFILFNLRRFFK